MFRTIVFFGPITPVFAGESLDPLVSASRGFSTAIQQQILAIQPGPSLIEFVAKTIVYADAKAAYFNAVREAAPELMNIATGREVLSSGESGPNYEYWSYTRLPNRVFRSVIEQRTLENCRLAGGTNPKIVLSAGSPGYFAIAASKEEKGNIVGWSGPLPRPEEATKHAIANCKKRGGTDPRIKSQWADGMSGQRK